jgi:mannitol PTS system EIIA component
VKVRVSISLDANRVFLGQEYPTKEEVVRAIGNIMLAAGDVTPRYVEGMLEKEDKFGTWVSENIALPHGTNEVKSEIVRNSVVVMQMPKGVNWGDGKLVRLAIGLASKGDQEHLTLLSQLAGVLIHTKYVETLIRTQSREEVVRILTRSER